MKNIAKIAALTLALTSTTHTASAETVTNKEPPCLTAGLSNELNSIMQSNEHIEYKTMYVSGDNVNVRRQPSKNSEVIKQVSFNEKVIIIENKLTNDVWYTVDLDNKIGYIHKDYVSDKPINYRIYNVPCVKNKTWMPYTAITSRGSKQYKLQQIAYTGDYGIRMVNGRYCVAIGSHFECKIGQYFDLILANGEVIPCIMADQKANKHTDSVNIITVDTNCLSEFIVDRPLLKYEAVRDGDVSSCCDEWDSPVVQIKVYKKVVKV